MSSGRVPGHGLERGPRIEIVIDGEPADVAATSEDVVSDDSALDADARVLSDECVAEAARFRQRVEAAGGAAVIGLKLKPKS